MSESTPNYKTPNRVVIEEPYWKRISKIEALMVKALQDFQKGLPADEILGKTSRAYDLILWDYEMATGIDFNEPKIYSENGKENK